MKDWMEVEQASSCGAKRPFLTHEIDDLLDIVTAEMDHTLLYA
jgi:hypothetical protein